MSNCFKCGGEIYFSDECLSISGKKIPLDEEYDGENMVTHDCPENEHHNSSKTTSTGSSLEKRLDALEKRVFNLEIGK